MLRNQAHHLMQVVVPLLPLAILSKISSEEASSCWSTFISSLNTDLKHFSTQKQHMHVIMHQVGHSDSVDLFSLPTSACSSFGSQALKVGLSLFLWLTICWAIILTVWHVTISHLTLISAITGSWNPSEAYLWTSALLLNQPSWLYWRAYQPIYSKWREEVEEIASIISLRSIDSHLSILLI